MSCAETSIWTAARVMSKQFDHPLILPHQIANADIVGMADHGRLLPSNGLTTNQMSHALSALGFHPIVYNKEAYTLRQRDYAPIELCLPYLVSKIPTILALPSHAVVACGVLLGESRRFAPDRLLCCVDELVNGLIVQDDTRGPYRIIPKDASTHEYLCDGKLRSLLVTPIRDPKLVSPEPKWWTTEKVESIIVPLPDKVYLTALDAHAFAKLYLNPETFPEDLHEVLAALARRRNPATKTFLAALEGEHGGLVYSVRCRKSTSVRSDFRNAHPTVRETLRDVSLPRLLWVIEVTTRDAFSSPSANQRLVFGEFYLDATAHQYLGPPSLVVAHVVGGMVVRPKLSRGLDDVERVVIQEDRPFERPNIPLWIES